MHGHFLFGAHGRSRMELLMARRGSLIPRLVCVYMYAIVVSDAACILGSGECRRRRGHHTLTFRV